jgi:hypothetical protein
MNDSKLKIWALVLSCLLQWQLPSTVVISDLVKVDQSINTTTIIIESDKEKLP